MAKLNVQQGADQAPDCSPLRPISVSVPAAITLSGLGRTILYEKFKTGEIETVLIGDKRLVLVASLEAFIERHRTAKFEPRPVPWAKPVQPPRRRGRPRRSNSRKPRPPSAVDRGR